MRSSERETRFVRECTEQVKRFIEHWYEITPDNYDLSVTDIHEDDGHLLRCLVDVYSDVEDIGDLVFWFTEEINPFMGPSFDVFQRL